MGIIEDLLVLHGRLVLDLLWECLRAHQRGLLGPDQRPCSEVNAHRTETASTSGTVDTETDDTATRKKRKLDKKVFVRNINFRTTHTNLWEFFKQFGRVKHCRLLKRDFDNRSRGMAIVQFDSEEAVQRALTAAPEDLLLDGRDLVVERAEHKERTRVTTQEEAGPTSDPLSSEGLVSDPLSSEEVPTPDPFPPGEDPPAPIHRLHEDILLMVFSYLSLPEKVRLEKVCRRWRQVALRSWQSLQHLDAGKIGLGMRGINDKDVKCLLKKTNPESLQSVDLSTVGRSLTDTTLETIGQLCPKVKEVDISRIAASNKGLRSMAEKCFHLETVKMNNCFYFGEDGLWWLFHRCKELRFLSLINNKRLKGQCFHVMCKNLQTLVLTGCSKLQDVGLVKISARCENLSDLTLDECYKLTDVSLSHLSQGCKHLKRLSLNDVQNVTEAGLKLIGELRELEELHLESTTSVTDSVVTAVAKGCKNLMFLNISCCYEVTNAGVGSLGNSQQLSELRVSYLHMLSDEGLLPVVQLGLLHTLVCRGCGSFSDDVMAAVAAYCFQLEVLDVSGCDQLSGAALEIFVNAEATRHSRLDIIAGGTGLVLEPEAVSPTLFVSRTNLCDRRLRKDQDLYFDMGFEESDDEDDDGYMYQPGDHPAAGGWGYPDDPYDDFLVNDDPLEYERWDFG